MNYYAFIPLAAFLINFFLFAYILSIPKKTRVHIAYMMFIAPCAVWQFMDFFAWSLPPGDLVMTIGWLSQPMWLIPSVIFLNFVYQFIHETPGRLFQVFLWSSILFSIIGLSSDWIVAGVRYESWGPLYIHGPLLFPALFVSTVLPAVYALMLLFRTWKKETDIVFRRQLMIIFMGDAFTLFFSLIPNVLIPRILHMTAPPQIGSSLLSIQSLVFFIAILRYGIFVISIKQSAYDVFSQVNDCVVILDRNQNVVEINNSAIELLGLKNVEKSRIDFQSLFGDQYSYEKNYNHKEISCEINNKRKTIVLSQNALVEAGFLTGKLVILRDFTARREAEQEIRKLNKQLEALVAERTMKLESARNEIVKKEYKSELADITSETLHNVKNILNSVKVSSEMIEKGVDGYARQGIRKANALLRENIDNLQYFISTDPKGLKLMEYYLKLDEMFDRESNEVKAHIQRLQEKINAIEEIVTSQQAYGGRDIEEAVSLHKIIDDALIMQSLPISNSNIRVIKQLEDTPEVVVKKTKVMHILVNLIKNAKEAMINTPNDDRVLKFMMYRNSTHVILTLQDTGCGIPPENIENMFAYGFTTKKDGHGYGLHSSINYMKEMGGDLIVQSDGENQGASFSLQFPIPDVTPSHDLL